MKGLQLIKNYFGGTVGVATALDITPQAVSQWDAVPLARAWQAYLLTKGELSMENLLEK